MRYDELYRQGCEILTKASVQEASLDARLILEYVCKTNRNDLLVHGDREISDEQIETVMSLLQKRSSHIPLQHLTGVQNFMGFDFKVNSHVLIPRQDTEILVEEVLENLHSGMRILDLCTGSGCILLSLLRLSNDCRGTGVDISRDALTVASENDAALLSGERAGSADWICRDVKEYFEEAAESGERFEIIVSNPPYINRDVVLTLMPEVKDHEPIIALDGGVDGLDFYRLIIDRAPSILWGGGMLFFEIGYDQGSAVVAMMEHRGFKEVVLKQDYAGLDRVVYGTWC